jgi:hypothetical protein
VVLPKMQAAFKLVMQTRFRRPSTVAHMRPHDTGAAMTLTGLRDYRHGRDRGGLVPSGLEAPQTR